eukprot:TRINITY_DN70508_c0_g1_i1.p1 TRINITY_DN70508_c0_g1~~TRINITY_DN70508_c0_g1_i1.p1  ORF type:complete len:295 (+),score=51.87 TRINITY_DN70508_c0_g1_i1:104-886(+)
MNREALTEVRPSRVLLWQNRVLEHRGERAQLRGLGSPVHCPLPREGLRSPGPSAADVLNFNGRHGGRPAELQPCRSPPDRYRSALARSRAAPAPAHVPPAPALAPACAAPTADRAGPLDPSPPRPRGAAGKPVPRSSINVLPCGLPPPRSPSPRRPRPADCAAQEVDALSLSLPSMSPSALARTCGSGTSTSIARRLCDVTRDAPRDTFDASWGSRFSLPTLRWKGWSKGVFGPAYAAPPKQPSGQKRSPPRRRMRGGGA